MNQAATKVEVWGGVECMCRRVQDEYSNQLTRKGHWERLDDLDRFAALGLRTLRYPVLWEHVAPASLDQPGWHWPDERLARLQTLGITPIVGLVHQGSGPRYTALDQPSFATGLAHYARLVAERYPWVMDYTPVNEPLTTARFSGLYGLWYPHGHDDTTFVRLLLNQLHATRLAMRAIREVNPAARLVQTEDLGEAHGTPALAAQVEFENHRRWLTQPALRGLHHPAYVDLQALRVKGTPVSGPAALLRTAWDRYHLPIAITEAYLGCTREEQLRWLYQLWQVANKLRASGVELRALTVCSS